MSARGKFRDDSAVGLMGGILPHDGLRQDLPIAGDKRDRAVVARGFETKDESHFACGPLP